jgi:hypothetical protein
MLAKQYFFIDESGDPNFYARRKRPLWTEPTFEPILMLGMTVVENRRALREAISKFQKQISDDVLFNSIHSVNQPNWFLHASKDHVDTRLKFIEFLRAQEGFKCYIAIGRKLPEIFHSKHNGKASEFYFDLLNKLLTLFPFEDEKEHILFLSQKQSSTEDKFIAAVDKALKSQSKRMTDTHIKCRIVASKDYPELSVIDYLMWTLKRYITQGDRRYFAALEDKFELIYDVYEDEGKGRIYDKTHKFDLDKASSFVIK